MRLPISIVHKKEYFYVVAKREGGQLVVRGGYQTARIANERGYYDLGGMPFKVEQLPYNDLTKATRHFKEMNLQETHNFEESIQRAVHTAINPIDRPYKPPVTYHGRLKEKMTQRKERRQARKNKRRE